MKHEQITEKIYGNAIREQGLIVCLRTRMTQIKRMKTDFTASQESHTFFYEA